MDKNKDVHVHVYYLDGPSVRVYRGVVVAVILHCPVHPQQLEDGSHRPQDAATHDQLLTSQHTLQEGDSETDRVMAEAGSVESGTAVTQVTEEDCTEITAVPNGPYAALQHQILANYA